MTEEASFFGLAGKKAMVIGGGQGMGESTSRFLARAGCDVAVIDLERERAERVAGIVGDLGRRGISIIGDVLNDAQIPEIVGSAERQLGVIDVMVSIVGAAVWGSLLETTAEIWHWKSRFFEPFDEIPLAPEFQPFQGADAITGKVKFTPHRNRRVELPDRAGSRVSRVGKEGLAIFLSFPVQFLKFFNIHIYLTAYVNQFRNLTGFAYLDRDGFDRHDIPCNVFPLVPVPPCRGFVEEAFPVCEFHGKSVIFRFDGILDFFAGLEQFLYPLVEFRKIVKRKGIIK